MAYRFSQLVGMEDAVKAVVVTLLRPRGGSLLLSGNCGTGKSMLLSCIESMCTEQIVRLPSSLNEDMLYPRVLLSASHSGGLIEHEGLLSRMRGRIVLIEHLNLMPRDLMSQIYSHLERQSGEDRYTIIATTNPREGAIPSALLDKFDLFVELQTSEVVDVRKRIILEAMREAKAEEDETLKSLLTAAMVRRDGVSLPSQTALYIAQVCAHPMTLGHRAEIALSESALSWAAWQNKRVVERKDVDALRELVLSHRMLSVQEDVPPMSEPSEPDEAQQQETNEEKTNTEETTLPTSSEKELPTGMETDPQEVLKSMSQPPPMAGEDRLALTEHSELLFNPIAVPARRTRERVGYGRRLYSSLPSRRGRNRRAMLPRQDRSDISLPATIRAAIPYQYERHRKVRHTDDLIDLRLIIHKSDYRVHQLQRRGGYHILFILDTSGSMGLGKRMGLVKGTIIELLKEAYTKRDHVGLLTFAQDEATLRLPFTKSVERAAYLMEDIRTGGRTPLWLAIEKANRYLDLERKRDPELLPVVVLLTDGRATSSMSGENSIEHIHKVAEALSQRCYRTLVIDTEHGFLRLGKARKIAEYMNGEYYRFDEIVQLKELITKQNRT